MKEIRRKLSDEYQRIRVETMHSTFKFMIAYSYLLSILGNFISSYPWEQKLVTFGVFTGITLVNFSLLWLIKHKVHTNRSKFNYYLVIALILTITTAYSSPGKYLTTLGVSVVSYSIVAFMVLSKKTMYFQAAITTTIMLLASFYGIGEEVSLSYGYPVVLVGSYGLIVYTLVRAIKMFKELEGVFYKQLMETNEVNVELTALNEEYQAVEQTLLYRLDHDDLTQALNRNGFEQKGNRTTF